MEMGERLRNAVAAYQSVRYVTRTDPQWKDNPQGIEAWLARIEREVRMAFYLRFTEEHKGEMTSTLIEQMAEEANAFIAQMKQEEDKRVVEAAA